MYKCDFFRHIVAINDTKVWYIATNSNKYKAKVINIRQTVAKYTNSNKYKTKCSKNSATSNNYSTKK